ncbi:MAG: hypothetical protein ACJAZ9_002163 [Neolewinella sp.]|jgi:hypothetical protein
MRSLATGLIFEGVAPLLVWIEIIPRSKGTQILEIGLIYAATRQAMR